MSKRLRPCPDCGAPVGERHRPGCDIERCYHCGRTMRDGGRGTASGRVRKIANAWRVEFKRLTGREREPGKLVKEFVCVSGAGGSRYCLLYVMPAP